MFYINNYFKNYEQNMPDLVQKREFSLQNIIGDYHIFRISVWIIDTCKWYSASCIRDGIPNDGNIAYSIIRSPDGNCSGGIPGAVNCTI